LLQALYVLEREMLAIGEDMEAQILSRMEHGFQHCEQV
jgi:hypothetical protein